MEYDAHGEPVVWKSVDNVNKTADSMKTLIEFAASNSLTAEAQAQVQDALTQLSIFIRKEALALRRVVDPKETKPRRETL
jgi:hypothetical protein